MKTIKILLEKTSYENYSFVNDFNEIILDQVEGYGKNKKALKSFLEDMQKGGCMTGIIGDFVYHHDCKEFYIKNIEDLEEFKMELEDQIGHIENRHKIVNYTFVVWLCFEEYCYNLYNNIFEG